MKSPTYLERYLLALPGGLSAHPECQIKASIYRAYQSYRAVDPDGLDLPPELDELLRHPAPLSTWLPATHSLAITMVYRDTLDSDDAFRRFVCAQTRQMYESRAYRILMMAVSPERLLQLARVRWTKFHRGFSLDVAAIAKGRARLVLEFPPHLYSLAHMPGMRGALQAALEASGARDVTSELDDFHARGAELAFTWQ